ncbi:hypothetical protein [Vibrio gazogenes]|uniref:Uncharacterized protein n=1 Tax=Vibrio gazogenes DSM 21264 = NBRC 103151 TaxID=1123492 RepID=A0A1M4Z7S8_VIBGA|nr:hypothetical protein [Vibrio gazogenes]USP12496.1 hypothetical protein MKS89_08465 [Vibrio gazogenes]SHF14074.1 hypothetical protein SAMN02745781_01507 [Vibrio gazogenes DSM 21264] [Vibrio gazogenes DSM 21264 = NBRC 103151]SJN53937.1 hypothetical protein BQ6471_00724 [Vibrio gazogenes]
MYETIPYDHQFAQKAREYLRQLEEIFEAEQRHNSQELRNVLLYLNNLITTHYVRYHGESDESDLV